MLANRWGSDAKTYADVIIYSAGPGFHLDDLQICPCGYDVVNISCVQRRKAVHHLARVAEWQTR